MAAHESLSPQQFSARYKPFARGEVDWTKTAYGHNAASPRNAYEHANGEAWESENGHILQDNAGSKGQEVFKPSRRVGSVN